MMTYQLDETYGNALTGIHKQHNTSSTPLIWFATAESIFQKLKHLSRTPYPGDSTIN